MKYYIFLSSTDLIALFAKSNIDKCAVCSLCLPLGSTKPAKSKEIISNRAGLKPVVGVVSQRLHFTPQGPKFAGLEVEFDEDGALFIIRPGQQKVNIPKPSKGLLYLLYESNADNIKQLESNGIIDAAAFRRYRNLLDILDPKIAKSKSEKVKYIIAPVQAAATSEAPGATSFNDPGPERSTSKAKKGKGMAPVLYRTTDDLKKKLEVATGEIQAGNNNPEVKNRALGLVDELVKKKGLGGGVPSAHDLRIYHNGGLLDELGIGDKGYQGGRRLLAPAKKQKSVDLTEDEEMMNKLIATVRITVERTIGRLKVFHCIGTRWRSSWELHPNAFFVIAQMVNLSFDVNPLVKTPHEIFKIVPQGAAQLAIQENLAPIIHSQ